MAKNARWAWRPPRYAHPPPANRPRRSAAAVWSLLGGGRQGISRAAADWLEIEMAGALPPPGRAAGPRHRRPVWPRPPPPAYRGAETSDKIEGQQLTVNLNFKSDHLIGAPPSDFFRVHRLGP